MGGFMKGALKVLLGVVGFFVLMWAVIVIGAAWYRPSPPLAPPTAEERAYSLCNEAVKLSARNPSSAEIPWPIIAEGAGSVVITWTHGQGLRLQNGFGVMVDATARCTYSKGSSRIVELIVDGRKLI